jgi:hypothetical protein
VVVLVVVVVVVPGPTVEARQLTILMTQHLCQSLQRYALETQLSAQLPSMGPRQYGTSRCAANALQYHQQQPAVACAHM